MAGVVFTSSDHHITSLLTWICQKQDRSPSETRTQQIAQMRGNMSQRKVLVHYHIFKNAGTTFERVLDENYGDGHIKFDGPFSFSQLLKINSARLFSGTRTRWPALPIRFICRRPQQYNSNPFPWSLFATRYCGYDRCFYSASEAMKKYPTN